MRVEADDRLLAHLQVVVITKLRRRESFAVSWRQADGSGRRTIWVNETLELVFEFSAPKLLELDRELLEQMTAQANSADGLDLDDHAHNPGPETPVSLVS
jgi:hypothetical protein